MAEGSNPLVRGERRCAVGVDEHGNIFAQYVRADWADAEIERLTAQRSEAMREITRMQGEIDQLRAQVEGQRKTIAAAQDAFRQGLTYNDTLSRALWLPVETESRDA